MNNGARWRAFLNWWDEVRPNAHLYEPDVLVRLVDRKIEELRGKVD